MNFAFIKELKDFSRFFKLPKEKKQIVFYSEHGGYQGSFEGIIQELLEKYNQDIVYITSDIKDPILKESDDRIVPLYINKMLSLFMPLVDSRVFVMTLTDLGNFYIKRSKNPVHYVYVFHALVSTQMIYNFGAFDNYDSVLCAGPHHIKEIQKQEELYKLKQKKLVPAGYYRLERIMNSFRQYEKGGQEAGHKVKTVLIAPSWGDKNILETCGDDLIDTLLGQGYKVIVRPHSETIRRFPRLIKKFEQTFGQNQNFKLEKSNASDDSIITADILICDCSGIALEYAFGTERPVIFMDVPLKIKNKKFKEIGEPLEFFLRSKIGRIVAPQNIKSIPGMIEDMIVNGQQYKKEIINLRESYLFNLGNSSKIGAKYLFDLTQNS